MRYLLALLIASLFPNLMAQTQPMNDEAQVRATVEQFMLGADTQRSTLLAEIMHPEAQQFFLGADGLVRLPRAAFFEMIDQKQIGGQSRTLNIATVTVSEDLALVEATMWNDQARFHNFISLMHVEGTWQIVSITLRMDAS